MLFRSWGVIHYYENNGTPENHSFIFVSDNFANIDVGEYSAPEFSDVDSDGDLDLFVGSQEGTVRSEERRVGKECRSRLSPSH